MVNELGQFHNVGQTAKRALGPLSSGSKDHCTHNAHFFHGWNFVLFQLRKILCFKPRVWKVERTEKLMYKSNALEGEVCLATKRVGSAHFPICLRRMTF